MIKRTPPLPFRRMYWILLRCILIILLNVHEIGYTVESYSVDSSTSEYKFIAPVRCIIDSKYLIS